MAGSASRGTNRPNSALGSNVVKGPFVGAATEKSEGGDVIDIHVSRSGGWWLPFLFGVGAGIAGTVAVHRWLRPQSSPPPALPPTLF
jgi:hypothetical protein